MTRRDLKSPVATVNQPCLFPRVHIMDRVATSETYVVLGQAQYMRKSDQALLWFTENGAPATIRVPMASGREPLDEKVGVIDPRTMRKSIARLERAWKDLPGMNHAVYLFELACRGLEAGMTLGDIGFSNIEARSHELGLIRTRFVNDYNVAPQVFGDPSTWMLRLCQGLGARTYYAGGTAINAYMKHEDWREAGVDLVEQDWSVPAEIVDMLGHSTSTSVLDIIARGPEAVAILSESLNAHAG